MSAFKPGDRVICVDALGALGDLAVDAEYVVSVAPGSDNTAHDHIRVRGSGMAWRANRFRPAQPSAEREEPKGPYVPKAGERVRVTQIARGYEDKWEPKVGDRVEWFDRGGHDEWFGATVSAVGSHATVLESDDGRTLRCPHGDRDLRPATPSPKANAAPGAPPKLDPDGYLNREALDERRRGERLDFGARRLAAVQAHGLDLDRQLPTVRGRLAAEVKAALRTWGPADDSDP